MAKAINTMEAKFLGFYLADPTGNATQAALKAGYSPKSAGQQGSQLLRKPKLIAEIEKHKASRREELSKESYIDLAIKDYKSLDAKEPNKPRFLDIAGKALGYIGANNDQKPSTINNLTQINITGAENQSELWELTRKLLGNE